MGLAETAKTLQQNISPEIAWLRKLRAYMAENTLEHLLEEYDQLEAYYRTEKGKADEKGVYIGTIDILERGHLAAFYGDVLKYAESKQHQDRHGGAEKAIKAHWEELQKMERGIRRRYEKQRAEEP